MSELLKKNLERHISLNPEEFDHFFNSFEINIYKKYAVILTSGQVCAYTNFVNNGLLRLYEIDENGYEKTTLFAREEYWVSDLYSFHSQKPGKYFLQALEDTEVFQLTKPKLERLFIEIPKLERFWRILHINSFIAQQERVMNMLTKPAAERYLDFIERFPKAELRISQKHIASYLGITPEFLSKLKSNIKS